MFRFNKHKTKIKFHLHSFLSAFWDTVLHSSVELSELKPSVDLRLALNSWSPCLHLSNAGTVGMYHAQLLMYNFEVINHLYKWFILFLLDWTLWGGEVRQGRVSLYSLGWPWVGNQENLKFKAGLGYLLRSCPHVVAVQMVKEAPSESKSSWAWTVRPGRVH